MVFLDSLNVRHEVDSLEPLRFHDSASVAKLSAWVMFAVQVFQAFSRDMRVDLCGRQVGMPKETLDRTQVGSALQKVCGERVPEHVGRDGTFDPGALHPVPRSPYLPLDSRSRIVYFAIQSLLVAGRYGLNRFAGQASKVRKAR